MTLPHNELTLVFSHGWATRGDFFAPLAGLLTEFNCRFFERHYFPVATKSRNSIPRESLSYPHGWASAILLDSTV